MPEQVTGSLDVLDAVGQVVYITLEVIEGMGSHMVARDLQGRTVFEFRPATLLLGADGNAGGLMVRNEDGESALNFNGTNSHLNVGTVNHLANLFLTGSMAVLDSSERNVLTFDSAQAVLGLGAAGRAGRLEIKDSLDNNALLFLASGAELTIGNSQNPGEIILVAANGQRIFRVRSNPAELRLGEENDAGSIFLLGDSGQAWMHGNGANGTLTVGSQDNGGTLQITNSAGRTAFSFDSGAEPINQFISTAASARIGTLDAAGRFVVVDRFDESVFSVDSQSEAQEIDGVITPGNSAPPESVRSTARVKIGGPRVTGDLVIEDGEERSALHFNAAETATLRFGSRDREGRLMIKDSANREVFSVEADRALVYLGDDHERVLLNGKTGGLVLRDENNQRRIVANAARGKLQLKDSDEKNVFSFDTDNGQLSIGTEGTERIRIDGQAGDILFENADVAEQFDVVDPVDSPPGTVMVLGDDRRLCPCSRAYDRCVVGVVAGSGAYRPGIVMDAGATDSPRVPISMFGKVCCRADTSGGPIRIGDLLTTSSTPGHAMRAQPDKAFGAVIGKALSPLEDGSGQVEMLISLQ